MGRIKGRQKGYALLVVILSMFMVTTLGAAMFTRVYTDLKAREGQEERILLQYAAQAGIEESLFRIHESIKAGNVLQGFVITDTSDMGEGLEAVTIESSISRTGNEYKIDCTAENASGERTYRVVATVSFIADSSSNITNFEIISYERSFNGN